MTETSKPQLTRTTVNLVPRAVEALNAAAEREQESRTDAINRALQVYDLITREVRGGAALILRAADGTMQSVAIL